ncbi:Retrovirus-related Pol polyprotein from transposon 297,Retrovirus-related Pol polyprotein from transposon 17.6 [Mytilus coruscus]|uniref:Retrovirus-related Pol polyprotein from transposon 297,Retrovirus-related Pol polyprotein from transposon 17.6 n=1 Tax=Mytilus coruscus TaxID=42192 RepID=A0A6J8BU27_MYTCO|nr:Retrovirus-related Pol polyprotein from transposon 297,Retrovirus-related Pol polyprotein from transposon 17.6 [Mytilus coruscus]
MPFGLCNAPSTFQRCMELIFRGLQWKTLLIYLDDIIIFSSDIDIHFQHLGEVLTRLKKAGLKLKPSKCDLIKEEFLYFGHIVGKHGVKPNPNIIERVQTWKTPSNTKETQLLGLCNYYRQFIKGFSNIAAPLSNLTRKDTIFEWTDAVQNSFDLLKTALCTIPVLHILSHWHCMTWILLSALALNMTTLMQCQDWTTMNSCVNTNRRNNLMKTANVA